MTIKEKLDVLASEKNEPCVTISLNTHRTHPENAQDGIMLRNLIKEAETRVVKEYGKRSVAPLLEKLANIESEIDANHQLDSLHLYLSNSTQEIIKSTWPSGEETVYISDSFDVRSLIKSFNRSEAYFILLLSQSGAHIYEALNDGITGEFINEDFPFAENTHDVVDADKRSDSKLMDNMVREYLNGIDKALVKVCNETGLKCVVVCTPENYSHLMKVADKPNIYLGNANIDYNNTSPHQLAKQSWVIVKDLQYHRRHDAIGEMKEAISQGKVLTDLQEIYLAAIDGRGDLLIIHQDFAQPVKMTDERTFEMVDEAGQPDVIEDIASNIAWEVLSKKGRVIFTGQDEIKDLGEIVLKTRY